MIRRGRRPAPTHPPVYLTDVQILEETPFIRRKVREFGVRSRDLDDVVQETVLGAWTSMTEGRFRPDPEKPLREALRVWLTAIAFNQASHYREKAYCRCEIPSANPQRQVCTSGRSTERQLSARSVLRELGRLPEWAREVLILHAEGHRLAAIAAKFGVPLGTAYTRLRLARRAFARALTRWRRP